METGVTLFLEEKFRRGNEGIRESPDHIKKVREIQRPTNVTQLRQFLGLINFQRKFIKNCSILSKPLTELTGGPKQKIISWNEAQINAFETLK